MCTIAGLKAASTGSPKPFQGNAPKIRHATFEDYEGIARLQRRNRLLPIKTEEQWRHLWISNPAYLKSPQHTQIGWVLETPDGNLVGYIGTIPLLYEVAGQQISTVAGYSWVVDPPFRSFSPLLVQSFLSQEGVELFIMATVNAEASPCLSLFGPRRVPVGEWDRSSFWITNFPGFTETWLRYRGVHGASALGRFSALCGLSSRAVCRHRMVRVAGGVQAEVCNNISSTFDSFWSELKTNRSKQILGVRTSEVLQWHFGPAMKSKQAWVLTVGDSTRLVAYGVFYRHDSESLGLTRMRLVDFQSLSDNPSIIASMLLYAFERCTMEGIDMLEVIGLHPARRTVVDQLAPFHRSLGTWLFYYQTSNAELDSILRSPSAWDPSQFDGDASL